MRKTEKQKQSKGGRVLARILAEDLRNIKISGALEPSYRVELTTDDGHGHWDMTNFPNDGYN